MKRVVVGRIMLLLFVLSIAGLFMWAKWAIDEPVPQPLPDRRIITPQVKRGEFMIVGAARVAGNECSGWIYRQITDAHDDLVFYETEFRPPTETPLPPTSVRRFLIPMYAVPGIAHYDVTIQWTCNLLQRAFPSIEVLPTLTFEIVDNPKAAKK